MSMGDEPRDINDDDEIAPPARGHERTVMVSAADLAALEGGTPWPGAAPVEPPVDVAPPFDPFAASAAAPDPFAPDPFTPAASDPFAPPTSPPAPVIPAPPPVVSTPPGGTFLHGSPGGLVGIHLNDLFEIVRFIAQGGMGEVYEGRNLASGEKVAIKVILPQYAADESFMALFRREASALERIGHDSLVKYRTLAFDRTNRVNYLAIEYVSGPSMADVLVGDSTDPALVRRVLKRLATGLGAAHEAGVIHRDLSPDNLLLPDGNVERCKIIDFGIAKDTNPGEKSVVGEAFAGKFGYAAPEIFGKFKRQVGPWTDVYSLALVMIAYAKGSPLDMGVTIVDALEARDTVPDLSSISDDLRPIFAKMLAPDPAERFRSMDEVVAALDAPAGSFGKAAPSPFGDTAPAPAAPIEAPAFVRATPTVAPPPPRATGTKSKLPLYGGIAAAVLIIAGGGGYALLGGKSTPPPEATTAAAPTETAATSAPAAAVADWATVRPQVLAALASVPCSDLRVSGTPSGGTVRLTGWHPTGATLPTGPGGWRIDASSADAVAQPSADTCGLISKLRAAVPASAESAFTVSPSQRVSLPTARRDKDGFPVADLGLVGQPGAMPHLLIVNIDDHAASAKDLVASADTAAVPFKLDAVPFDKKPGRYLTVLIASPGALAPVTADGPPAALRAACANGGCTLASGWVEITP